MEIAVFLGLKSDTSKFSLQINFFLLARHYIWGCGTCNRSPQLKMFLYICLSLLQYFYLYLIFYFWLRGDLACNMALDAVQTVVREQGDRKEIDIKNYAKVEKVNGNFDSLIPWMFMTLQLIFYFT